MRGLIFSIDFIISMMLMILVIFSLFSFNYTLYTTSEELNFLNTLGQDAVTVMSTLKVNDSLELEVISYYMDTGDIDQGDLNRTLSDVVGTFIVMNMSEKAENITSSIFGPFLPNGIGYNVTFNNMTFSSTDVPVSGPVISVKTFLSGYDINRSIEGFISRAWLDTAIFNETLIVPISPIGSGFRNNTCVKWFWFICTKTVNGGNLTIMKTFEVPDDAQEITSANLYLSLHEEDGNVYVYMNGELQYTDDISATEYAILPISDIAIGNNTLVIIQEMPDSYHAHTHPGMLLEVNYIKERRIGYFENRTVQEIEFFPEIVGSPVAWGTFPFHIPRNSSVSEATLHLEATGVDDYYEVWVNDQRVLREYGPPLSPVININMTPYLHMSEGLTTGETNVVSAYFDMVSQNDYPTEYASGNCTIKNASYIYLNYTRPDEVQKYGVIPVTQTETFEPPSGYLKTKSWYVQENEIMKAYLHVAQRYSWKIAVAAWHSPESEPTWDGTNEVWLPSYMQIFKSPTGRNVPSSVYIPPDRLASSSTNYVKVRDTNDGSNHVLPNSTVEYVLLVPANVGYGEVFSNETEAINDAIDRLRAIIEPYHVEGDIIMDSISISGISWLWGPAEIKVVLWT